MSARITIAGSIAQKPDQAGHAWQFLQYLLGFRDLGCEVLFLDTVDPSACTNADGSRCAPEDSAGVRYLADVMAEFGLGESWSVAVGNGDHLGVPRDRVIESLRGSEVLINVMGFITDEALLGAARRRVFLDTDPGFGQMWADLGLADVFAGHDAFVTIAGRIGSPDCTVPTCGLDWVKTPQPVVLDQWPAVEPTPGRPFTSVGRWRGAYGPVDYDGHRYGLRVHEFRRFAELPRRSGAAFELALDIHPDETADLKLLRETGWTLADPLAVASTPDGYRRYLQRSGAEVMIAKGMYVDSRSGWFSERSICYLASGRPVLAQDTGLADLYPVGSGLVTFSTLDEAVAGVEAITAAPEHHAAAARELAEEYFDSRRVLSRLLDQVAA